jgi:arginine-tRNA-protein transferase
MQLLQELRLSDPQDCPYLPGRQSRMAHFFAQEVTAAELDKLLETGWRKFGYSFFRPLCPECRECVPLRIPVARFLPSKSQRRVMRGASPIAVSFKELEPGQEIYDVFRDHAQSRFGKPLAVEEFLQNFCLAPCPALQSEYRLDGALVAAGIIDRSERALSSVYFAFRAAVADFRPGVLSVIAEIAHAVSLGLDYYYLGYWIAGNPSMAYKSAFRPHEVYDWEAKLWRDA